MNKKIIKNFKEVFSLTFIGLFGSLVSFIISRLNLFSHQGNKTFEGLAFGLGAVGIGALILTLVIILSPSARNFMTKNQKIQENDERLQSINNRAQAKTFSITLYALCISLILSCIIELDAFIILTVLLVGSGLTYIILLNYYSSKL